MGDSKQLPGHPSGQEDAYPWVQAMQAARRRLPRVKVAIAAAGAFALGILAAIAAGSTGTVSAAAGASPSTSSSAATTDIFGQTPAGPDNPPAGSAGDSSGAAPEQAPRIVTAQS